ncbi:MAG TPA: bifunctional glutamine synthetase adenylyltransferase/deadenyltransferase, partial [Massilia sp.]|nr:bifunctional glutamine synthetase adenylyltransferase/deadenyltransferase [Massilia sp.]
LRNLEHRLQYLDDAQTHTLPPLEPDRELVAHMMGLPDVPTLLARLEEQRAFVAAEFDDMFADKSAAPDEERAELEAIAADPEQVGAIEAHLAALGFGDPADSARRLVATCQAPRLQSLPDASRARLLSLVRSRASRR